MLVPTCSIPPESAPEIFRPMGVRMPVANMSMRPLMGMVHALLTPGTFREAFISRTSSSEEIVSRVKWRKTDLAVSGAQEEYQVGTRRHLERGLGATGLSEHMVDLGEASQYAVGRLQQSFGLGNGDAGHGGGHVEDGAFVKRRHELRTQAEEHRNGYGNHGHSRGYDDPLPAERPPHDRLVGPHKPAGYEVLIFRADPAYQQRIHRPAEPPGAKAEGFYPREQQTQSRVEGNGHTGGDEHGQSLRVSQRFEHPPFLRLES